MDLDLSPAGQALLSEVRRQLARYPKGLPRWQLQRRLNDRGFSITSEDRLHELLASRHDLLLVGDRYLLRRPAGTGSAQPVAPEPLAGWDLLMQDLTMQLSDISLDLLRVTLASSDGTRPLLRLRCDVVLDGQPELWWSLPATTPGLVARAGTADGAWSLSPGCRLPFRPVSGSELTAPTLLVWKAQTPRAAAGHLRTLLQDALQVRAERVRLEPELCAPGEADRRAGIRAAVQRTRAKQSSKIAVATCDRCGLPLTDPASVADGVGPECRRYYSQEYFQAVRRKGATARMWFAAKKPKAWLAAILTENPELATAAA